MLNIVFMGTPDFAVPSLKSLYNSNHTISAVVTSPDKPAGRGRNLTSSAVKLEAKNLGLRILQPLSLIDKDFLSQINQAKPDLFIIVAFRKLPKVLFEIPPLGAVNLHASLLPKYRGAAPIHHALLNDETQTGVTTFRINNKIDTGHILLQKKIGISADDTLEDLWVRLSVIGGKTVVETVNRIENGSIEPKKQDEKNATPAPKITSADCIIDWSLSAIVIHNRIRALTPKPGAYTILNNNRVKLFESRVEYDIVKPINIQPGFMSQTKTKLIFMTGNGTLSVSSIQLQGKKRMDVRSFLSGNKISKEICNAN